MAVTFCASLPVNQRRRTQNCSWPTHFSSPSFPPPLPFLCGFLIFHPCQSGRGRTLILVLTSYADCKHTFLIYCCFFFCFLFLFCFCISYQADALKIIRYLQHSKYAPSVPTPLSHPKEAWTSKVSSNSPPTLTSRGSTLSQRSLNSSTPARNSMNKSKYLGVTCVRHVIHHCAGYLLDSLEPPVPRALGRTSLMVIREAVINGAVNKTHALFHTNYPERFYAINAIVVKWLCTVMVTQSQKKK